MYDIIIIGAGSAGLGLSSFMNKAGFTVLLVDRADHHIGGDCLNFGCVPSKALIHVAKQIWHAKEKAPQFGLTTSGDIDIKKVMDYIQHKQNIIREHENAEYLRSTGIDVVLGHATFASSTSIAVEGKEYHGKKIVVSTGSRPRELSIPGVEQAEVYTNETIFSIQTLPKQFLFIGAGPIAVELGQAFQRLGSQVTFLIRSDAFLRKEDKEVATILLEQLKKEGCQFLFNTTPKEFVSPTSLVVTKKDESEETLSFDAVFSGIGRIPNLDRLSSEKAHIELQRNGKPVLNEYMQSTNKRVYIIGDAAGGLQFTHAAELHIRLLLNNFFSPIKKKLNTDTFPWVTYTDPEIATFGLNEKTLEERGVSYTVIDESFSNDDRAIVDEGTCGRMKLFVHKNKLLGGTVISQHAGEISQELMLVNSSQLSLRHLFNKIYPYPTAGRVIGTTMVKYFSDKTFTTYKKMLKWLYH
ncbi:MAG: NAD(P)/FAD-dependent oxidoreductase [Candidatus Magasanikbacteria bacterium]|jgi:pyruvate/2-oxoglutarate dehydrogenase complex dihydrolipoamide dehydrogenase (E3) component|nr:NAD(P)/FAD-dependent oxidoreductase [Candidatus Magasanikbacteria bacterium]